MRRFLYQTALTNSTTFFRIADAFDKSHDMDMSLHRALFFVDIRQASFTLKRRSSQIKDPKSGPGDGEKSFRWQEIAFSKRPSVQRTV